MEDQSAVTARDVFLLFSSTWKFISLKDFFISKEKPGFRWDKKGKNKNVLMQVFLPFFFSF